MDQKEYALKKHEEWGGKLSTESKCPLKTKEDLALFDLTNQSLPIRNLQISNTKAWANSKSLSLNLSLDQELIKEKNKDEVGEFSRVYAP